MKANPSPEEIERGNLVAARVGLSPASTREFDLPEGAGHRTILRYVKIAVSQVPLPRREGLAQHDPLA